MTKKQAIRRMKLSLTERALPGICGRARRSFWAHYTILPPVGQAFFPGLPRSVYNKTDCRRGQSVFCFLSLAAPRASAEPGVGPQGRYSFGRRKVTTKAPLIWAEVAI